MQKKIVMGRTNKRKRTIRIIIIASIAAALFISAATFLIVKMAEAGLKGDDVEGKQSILETAVDYQEHWAKDYIVEAVNKGILTGTSPTTIDPDGSVARSQFVMMLSRLDNGKNPVVASEVKQFDDVLNNFYYTEAINWASSNHLVDGISDESFVPNHLINREQALSVLYEYFKLSNDDGVDYSTFEIPYSDSAEIDNFANEGVRWAFANNIVDFIGYEEIDPMAEITRAELAVIMVNYLKTFVD